jgi:hypothetical protein
VSKLVEIFQRYCWALIESSAMLLETYFDLAHLLQSQVPAALEFRRNEPVLWIRCVILPFGSHNGKAKTLQPAEEWIAFYSRYWNQQFDKLEKYLEGEEE